MINGINSRAKGAVDDGSALADTVLTIVKEVGEMLASVPYVKSVSGIVLQLIKIRDEVKINKERCQEIIDKILNISKIIYERLLELGKSNAKNKLGRLESHLVDYGRTLGGIYKTMEKHASRSTFRKIIQRGLDDLNRYDRVLDNFNSKIILDILIEIRLEQSTAVKRPEPGSILDLSAHHVLPPKPHLIIERDQELKSVVDMLLLEGSSRIAILGGGGIGKTTTALAALHNPYIAMRYSSRYFLSCESILSVEGLLTGILNILGIQSAHRNADNLGTICHSLQRPTKTVLCLDNFETPWEPSETRAKVEDILSTLASISNLTLIITLRGTQRPAKIAWTKPLLPPLDTLSLSGSEVIVQEIVGFMDDDIHRLLDSVDGVPLAVTLISYLIRDGEPPHSLWKRWPTERTKMIERGGDDPQSNLDASISLSIYSPRMRKDLEAIQILAALSLLPDGFPASDGSLDALQTHTAAKNIHRSLQTLRSVALVTTDEKAGHPRLRMLSPVRLFCQQSLTKEVSQSLNGMTSYYIQIIKTAKYRYYIASLYASVQPEVKNIHAVFQKAFNEGYPDTESLINATIYVTSWSRYVGYMFDDTIQLAHTHSKNSPKLRAECLRAMGLLYHVWNRLDNAKHSFTQAFELYKADNNTYGQGTALKSLGDIHILRNQLDDAERTLNQAQNLFKQAQSRKGEANGLRSLAELYSRRDQILDAETALNKALDYYEISKNTSGQLYVQDRLGALNLRRDRLDEAALSFSRAIELSIQNCNVTGEANALLHIGDLFMRRDRLDDARVALERAQTLYKQTQNIVGETNVLNCLGWLSIRLDRLADAEIILRTASANASNALAEGNSLWYLGCAYTRMNQLEDAELALSKAQKKYDEAQNASGKAYVLGHLAAVYLRQKRFDTATRVLKAAEKLSKKVNNSSAEATALHYLRNLHTERGQWETAKSSLLQALQKYKEAHSSPGQGDVHRSMGDLMLYQSQFDEALRAYKDAQAFHHKAQWISEEKEDIKKIGELHRRNGAFEAAEKVFESARLLGKTRIVV